MLPKWHDQGLVWMRMYSSQPTYVEVDWSGIKLSFIQIHFNTCGLKWIHMYKKSLSKWQSIVATRLCTSHSSKDAYRPSCDSPVHTSCSPNNGQPTVLLKWLSANLFGFSSSLHFFNNSLLILYDTQFCSARYFIKQLMATNTNSISTPNKYKLN